MQTFRIEVGHIHGVKPGNIVGAIANEAELDSKHIGRIEIYDDHSTLDLPDDMPDELLHHLKKVWVAGQQLNIRREGEPAEASKSAGKKLGAPAFEDEGPRTDKIARKSHAAHREETVEPPSRKKERDVQRSAPGMQTYRIEVGRVHGVKPANIVGAIANEASIEPKYIGRIDIHDDYSTLDLPEGMPKELFKQLKSVTVSGQQLRISLASKPPQEEPHFTGRKFAPTTPRDGGDRKAGERKLGGKPPIKTQPGSGKRTADTAKGKPKPHRKGPKPA
jgi:ATP-dependent RNA helicase DeaD